MHPDRTLHLVSEPVLGSTGQLFACQLRAGAIDDQGGRELVDDEVASVLTDALASGGLDALMRHRPTFMPMSKRLLLDGFATVLPTSVVLDVDASDLEDAAVRQSYDNLRALGYAFSFSTWSADTDPKTLSKAKYLKVDSRMPSQASLNARDQHARQSRLVATHVHASAALERALNSGCSLFEGRYFERPTPSVTRDLGVRRIALAQLVATLNKPGVTPAEIEDVIKRDAALTVRVLRSVNSSAFGIRREVQSVSQAMVLLGVDQVKRWVSVWTFLGLQRSGNTELLHAATKRARACERVGEGLQGDSGTYFLTGLCSLLDAMLGQPMIEILSELPLPTEVNAALTGARNTHRAVLDAVVAYGHAEWEAAARACREAGISGAALSEAYRDAIGWANEVSELAQAA